MSLNAPTEYLKHPDFDIKVARAVLATTGPDEEVFIPLAGCELSQTPAIQRIVARYSRAVPDDLYEAWRSGFNEEDTSYSEELGNRASSLRFLLGQIFSVGYLVGRQESKARGEVSPEALEQALLLLESGHEEMFLDTARAVLKAPKLQRLIQDQLCEEEPTKRDEAASAAVAASLIAIGRILETQKVRPEISAS